MIRTAISMISLFFLCAAIAAAPVGSFPSADEWKTSGAPAAAPGDAYGIAAITGNVTANANGPVVAMWNTNVVKPDESLVLTGIRLTNRVGAQAGSDCIVWLYAQGAPGSSLRQCHIAQVDARMLTAIVPADVPFGMYTVWVENEAGVSTPIVLNRPTDLWIGPLGATASPGQTKRIFGKNLSHNHDTLSSHVYIDGAEVAVTNVEPYAVTFTVPASLGSGAHAVYLHSGHGGAYGWGGPLSLTVAQPWQRGSDAVTVSPSGANDGGALQTAIDQMSARASGGTVRLTSGTYRLTGSPLEMKDKVRLVGAGMDTTTINLSFTSNQMAGILLYANHSAVESLTVYQTCTGCLDYGPFKEAYPDGRDDIRLIGIRATGVAGANGRRCMVTAHPGEVTGCEFSRQLSLQGSDLWVHDNTFYGGPYGGTNIDETEGCITGGGTEYVMERNHFETRNWPMQNGSSNYRDFMTPDQYAGTIWAKRAVSWGAGNENVYIGHNTTKDVAVDDNKGEMFLFHGLNSQWFAQVGSNSGRTLTIRTDGLIDGKQIRMDTKTPATAVPNGIYWDWPIDNSAYVIVQGGTGSGQARRVQSHTATTITVFPDWRVPPASDSKITLAYNNRNVVIYANEMNAFPAGFANTSNASCAYDFDGNTWESVGEANISHRTSGTVRICGGGTNPSCWNDLRAHRGYEAYWGGQFMAWEWEQCQSTGPWLLGNTIRESSFEVAASRPAAGWWGSCLSTGLVDDAFITDSSTVTAGGIIEHNTGIGGQNGYYLESWSSALYRKNTTDKSIGMSADAQGILLENTHAGSPSQSGGADLPIPLVRVAHFSFDATYPLDSLALPIANGGVKAMQWSVTDDQTWIEASVQSGGTVAVEQTTGVLRVRVTTSALSPTGRHWGLITLTTTTGKTATIGVLVEPRGSTATAALSTHPTRADWMRVNASSRCGVRATFSMSQPGTAHFALYGLTGRVVAQTTLRGVCAGVHEIAFDKMRISNGFYVAEIETSVGFSSTQRVAVR